MCKEPRYKLKNIKNGNQNKSIFKKKNQVQIIYVNSDLLLNDYNLEIIGGKICKSCYVKEKNVKYVREVDVNEFLNGTIIYDKNNLALHHLVQEICNRYLDKMEKIKSEDEEKQDLSDYIYH